MSAWEKNIQTIVDAIDEAIESEEKGALTLASLSSRLGYSESYLSHAFSSLTGTSIKNYLRERKLSLALLDLRDGEESVLAIALRYGFSSHEAFTRAFKKAYGITPHAYRKNPVPVALRTILRPYDCFLVQGAKNMSKQETNGAVKTYFIHVEAHKFLHIRNYKSIGYWDFWQKQSEIPGQDCDTVCGTLLSIPHILDAVGGKEIDASSGQLMAWINAPEGRICSWGIPLAEAYGVRLPLDYDGPTPDGFRLMDVPEGDYIVFEHGPFDFETESEAVEAKIEAAMKSFDYEASGYELDLTPERVFYFYHDCARFFKYVRPVKRVG